MAFYFQNPMRQIYFHSKHESDIAVGNEVQNTW